MVNDIQRVFSNELDVVATGPNLRNIMVGTGAGLIVLMLAGIYIANREQRIRENARANDHQIRAEVAEKTEAPTDEAVRQKTAAHPEMLYILPGSFVMGRLHQEDVTKIARARALAKEVEVPASSTASSSPTASRMEGSVGRRG